MNRWSALKVFNGNVRRRRAGVIAAVVAMAVVIQCGALLVIPFVHVGAAQATLTGKLGVLFADPASGQTLTVRDTRYFLSDSNGTRTELLLDPGVTQPFGGTPALIGQEIVATVNIPVGPRVTADTPRAVTAITLASGVGSRLQSRTAVLGDQPFVNLLCKFSDKTREPEALPYFSSANGLMSDGPGTVGEYWNAISYNLITVHGSQTYNWVTLPGTETSYKTVDAQNKPDFNYTKVATDCAQATINANPTLNLDAFKGINFMLNDEIVGFSLGGQVDFTLGGNTNVRAQTWLMPWAYHIEPPFTSGPAPMEHEMGHAFLLWHSGNITGKEYQDSWDVMGNSYVNCDALNLVQPPYGCPGQSVTSYDKDNLNWISGAQKLAYAGITRQITLTSLLNGTTGNYLTASIPHTSNINFTYVEMRFQTGLDNRLPGSGVIIHEIDTTNTSISKRVQSTNGDVDAIRAVGQAYAVPDTSVSVTVKSVSGNNAVVVISSGLTPTVTTDNLPDGAITTGATLTLTGANFSPEATVNFGTVPAIPATVNGNGTSLTVVVPAYTGNGLPITVTNPDGRSGLLMPKTAPPTHAAGVSGNGTPAPQPPAHPTIAAVPTPLPQPTRH